MTEPMKNTELLDALVEFYRDYYWDEISELIQHYPQEQKSLWIDYDDVWRFDPELADDITVEYDTIKRHFSEALVKLDVPVDVDLSGVNIRIYNFPAEITQSPSELRNGDAYDLVALKGTLAKATGVTDKPEVAVFECTSGHTVSVPQNGPELQEPSYCDRCEGRPNWRVKYDSGEWTDQMKIKVETPPDETGAMEGSEITGYVTDDLVEYGSEFGLVGRTGEQIIVNGIVKREQRDGRGDSGLVFDQFVDVESVEFANDSNDVDAEEHKETFTELANSENPLALWKASIAPELYATPEWDRAFELGIAYLFAAPRINIPNGPTYRGDIHMLIVSDYGMGKSTFTEGIAEYSPKCIKKSATGLASDVGLTASAVRDDDFGEGSWTLKPGILVRGNGGHVILDEIDKGPDDLAKMNDALEGEQIVTVDKAGKDATFNSKVGLLGTGNPVDGRFGPNTAVAPQIGVDSSLLSRFDGIVTMRDEPDKETDANVSQRIGEAYKEAQEVAFADRDEMDILDRPVSTDVGKAWVKYARENINPTLTQGQIEDVEEWYASEVRQFNNDMQNEGASVDPPVPVTPRVVEDTLRMAVAFARMKLRENVGDDDLELAKDLRKTLAGQTFEDGFMENVRAREGGAESQLSRKKRIQDAITDEYMEPTEIAAETDVDIEQVNRDLEKWHQRTNPSPVTKNSDGEYRWIA